ncbi:hypothetical protein D9611_011148 [Ephemerocybe angulata]|uniref:Uncharacterized protein n=1 Tax=Ephemerocybe angulata TaxID=980116 RepID=A0A8H5CCH0_9AGAR|nr:hypothetical protein D9611_011148 [Tulosesus angulatus]
MSLSDLLQPKKPTAPWDKPKTKPKAKKDAAKDVKGSKAKQPNPSTQTPARPRVSIPVYISIVGVHTTLLSYTALFLPRTKVLQDLAGHYASDASSSSAVPTSQDRPQHPFLTALTSSPGVTLFALCAGTLILQTWWASWLRGAWVDLTVQGTEDERAREKFPEAGKKARHLATTYASVVVASLLLHVVLVLFGAPMNEYVHSYSKRHHKLTDPGSLTLKTYLLALLISTLVVLPASYVLGPPTWSTSNDTALLVKRWTWVRLFAELSPRNTVERALVYPAVGTVLGAWAGIIPTALDWDRPWQAWPLTPAYGALLGYIASSILAVTLDAVISTNAANPL